MDATADELAGVVDLFGGLTRAELERALSEAAFRADGQSVDETALSDAIDEAIDSFALVRCERTSADAAIDGQLLVAGPTAFPSVPAHAEDVPHILDIEPRQLDREAVGDRARARFVEAVDRAVDAGDDDQITHLIDVSYDIEAWAPIDVDDERQRLAECLE